MIHDLLLSSSHYRLTETAASKQNESTSSSIVKHDEDIIGGSNATSNMTIIITEEETIEANKLIDQCISSSDDLLQTVVSQCGIMNNDEWRDISLMPPFGFPSETPQGAGAADKCDDAPNASLSSGQYEYVFMLYTYIICLIPSQGTRIKSTHTTTTTIHII